MSKKLKLSPWHNGSVKPVHIGWYEVSGLDIAADDDGIAWRKWDGSKWLWNALAHRFPKHLCDKDGLKEATIYETDKWRGILK